MYCKDINKISKKHDNTYQNATYTLTVVLLTLVSHKNKGWSLP